MRIILASNNEGKILEVKSILGEKYEVFSLKDLGFCDDILEYGETFHINALIKAQEIQKEFPNDIIIADDSGLCVEQLDFKPGVYSSRYGKDIEGYHNDKDLINNKLLLSKLEGVTNRNAFFKTVICVVRPDVEPVFYSGELKGSIGYDMVGNNGFGYDPLFIYDGRTLAQMNSEEKNLISHRKKALRKIKI